MEKSCNNCKYYYRHYIKLGTRFKAINCGHCAHLRKIKRIGLNYVISGNAVSIETKARIGQEKNLWKRFPKDL